MYIYIYVCVCLHTYPTHYIYQMYMHMYIFFLCVCVLMCIIELYIYVCVACKNGAVFLGAGYRLSNPRLVMPTDLIEIGHFGVPDSEAGFPVHVGVLATIAISISSMHSEICIRSSKCQSKPSFLISKSQGLRGNVAICAC